MPNWTTNEVTVTAKSAKDLSKFIKQIESEDNPFDFEKIEPMPKNIFRGNLGRKEKELHGKNNWYDWSWKNWGTKWNSCHTEFKRFDDKVAMYIFQTAWCPPVPIWEALMNIYSGQVKGCPAIHFEWHCLDEDDDTDGEGYQIEEVANA